MKVVSYRIDAVVFDFDGTLTAPGALDFSKVKKTIGCPDDLPVLEFMEREADGDRRAWMAGELDRFEMDAAAVSRPNAGAGEIFSHIRRLGLPVGILTRNSRSSVLRSLENFEGIGLDDIGVLVTREEPVRIKPSGEGVRFAADRLNVDPAHVLVVGDFLFDIQAGRRAGALTAFLTNGKPAPEGHEAHFAIQSLDELIPILTNGVSLPAGKLPNDFLGELLARYRITDPSVIMGPSVGEDTAAVTIDGETVLVLKTDPITFATESIGRYAVLINANDLATAGAEAHWMLCTLLLPVGFSRSQVRQIFVDLHDACQSQGISLCGGHTEITDAVTRPVVVGMLAGTIARDDLIQKKRMAPGDRVLVTKGIAVEGTAIIAAEFRQRLLEKGMDEKTIDACRSFQSMLSILPEARIAWKVGGVSALHDVTEGGIATALLELSMAGGQGIRVRKDLVPVFPQTQAMADILGIDPLGLIASGSLLISVHPDHAGRLIHDLKNASIAVTEIGEVTDAAPGIEAVENGRVVDWPRFDVDEITRLFA